MKQSQSRLTSNIARDRSPQNVSDETECPKGHGAKHTMRNLGGSIACGFCNGSPDQATADRYWAKKGAK